MFAFVFAVMESSIQWFPLEAYIIFTTRDHQRAIQSLSRQGDAPLYTCCVDTSKEDTRPSGKGLSIGYSSRGLKVALTGIFR